MTSRPEQASDRMTATVAPDKGYLEWVRQAYPQIIENLPLEPLQRRYLHDRWLAEFYSLNRDADFHRKVYYALRGTAIVGSVSLPLVGTLTQAFAWNAIPVAVVSSVVALVVAVEALVRPSERYRHFRRAAELVKAEGWRFIQLTDPYRRLGDHRAAYPTFAGRLERQLTAEVEDYVGSIILPQDQSSAPAAGRGRQPPEQ